MPQPLHSSRVDCTQVLAALWQHLHKEVIQNVAMQPQTEAHTIPSNPS